MKRLLSLLAAVLALHGCGGPDPASRSAPPAPAGSPPEDARPVIAAFGDSLTEGFGVDPDHSYPAVLQREIDARGYRYRVANLGVSGETTADGLERLPAVLDLQPAIVVLEFGANDGLRGLPVARARENLDRMIAALRERGAAVILAGMTLPSNYGALYVGDFERMYRDLAARHHLPLIPFFLEGAAEMPRCMLPDGVHPNAEGYVKVAHNVLTTLEPLLKAGR